MPLSIAEHHVILTESIISWLGPQNMQVDLCLRYGDMPPQPLMNLGSPLVGVCFTQDHLWIQATNSNLTFIYRHPPKILSNTNYPFYKIALTKLIK